MSAHYSTVVSPKAPGTEPFQESTLEEPIWQTVKRDLKNIGNKLRTVLLPKSSNPVESEWDLWGPLIFCLLLSVVLGFSSKDSDTVFTLTFLVFWVGAGVVTLNANLLGGKVSVFQAMCTLGYCVFPLLVSAILMVPFVLKLFTVSISFSWSVWAAARFFSRTNIDEKRLLVLFPVILFYLFLAWAVLISNPRFVSSTA